MSMILPVLPLRSSILFPDVTLPYLAGRPGSAAAIEAAMATEDKSILLLAQKNAGSERPQPSELYAIGTRGMIRKVFEIGAQFQVIVQGLERVEVERFVQTEPFLKAKVTPRPVRDGDRELVEATRREVFDKVSAMQGLMTGEGAQLAHLLGQIEDPLDQAYLLASILPLDVAKRQAVLEADTRLDALKLVLAYVGYEAQILKLRQEISSHAQQEMTKEQREYALRQQLRAIQEELHEAKPEESEVRLLRERLAKAELPDEARKELERELSRLEKLSGFSPESQVSRGYLEFALDLPWKKSTEDALDLGRARSILDEDHFDLKEVKQRILEQLAVLKLNPKAKAPILCFVGPPGTGKTSLGQSIARALGRRFERMSLGGMHDEAELRGHRRTYVGAMPGRIIQAIRRAGVNNPLLMLDEIDKLGREFHGDPSAALMEILDPAQNFAFHDNYLDLPFDLSRVLFITTANTLDNVPGPLLDRMEVLRLSGYTEEEKLEIARRYLLPRQLAQTGIKPEQLRLSDDALRRMVRRYTREAGLRQLERAIGSVARKLAVRFAEGKPEAVDVDAPALTDLLGPEPFFFEEARRVLKPGVAPGLAWTETGGEVLYIEAILLGDSEGLTMTGHLGEVMKESVQAAFSYVRSRRESLDLKRWTRRAGVHVHVPAGAVPKDGPSAGLAVAAAIASLLSDKPALSDTALTGEVTLTGLVLPVGGIKEKVLAARRSGIKRVVLPKANEKDLSEVPEPLRRELEFVLVEEIDRALEAAIPGLGAIPAGSPPLRRFGRAAGPRGHAKRRLPPRRQDGKMAVDGQDDSPRQRQHRGTLPAADAAAGPAAVARAAHEPRDHRREPARHPRNPRRDRPSPARRRRAVLDP